MKKTLVALAVAAFAATSANAVVVYNQDGTKVEVEGSVRLILEKASSKKVKANGTETGESKRADLKNDGSRLWVKASQDLGEGFSAIGGLELRFDGDSHKDNDSNSSFGNPTTRQLFAGFKNEDVGTLTFGRQETTLDAVQLSDFTYTYGGNNNLTDFGFKSVKFKSTEWEGFSFGADYIFGDSAKDKAAPNYKNGYGLSAFYSTELADDVALNLSAGLGQDRFDAVDTNNAETKKTNWRTAAQLVAGPAAFGIEYGQGSAKVKNVTDAKGKVLLVSAKYQVLEPATVYAQYQRVQVKEVDVAPVAKVTENKYIVGADYKFNKHVVTFVEYQHARTSSNNVPNKDDFKGRDNALALGLRVFF